MDHVRVGLDAHQLVDRDAAVLAHAAEVVAAEVDEHHVLGALLLVGEQLPGHRGPVGARRAGGCRRSGRCSTWRPATLTSDSGEAPGDLEVLEVEEVHVGARVDRRAGRGRSRTPPPGSSRSSAGWAPPGRRRRRGCTRPRARPPRRSRRGRGWRRTRAAPDCRRRAGAPGRPGARARRRSPPRPGRRRAPGRSSDEHVREHRHLVAQVVEGHQHVGDHQRQVGHARLVGVRAARPSARRCARGRSRTGRPRRRRTAAGPPAGRSGSAPAPRATAA